MRKSPVVNKEGCLFNILKLRIWQPSICFSLHKRPDDSLFGNFFILVVKGMKNFNDKTILLVNIKQNNLCEYGEDIINNTEHLNLNKNVLTKKYYIIIPYYSEEAQNPDLDKEEILNIAFSELYTRAQSIIRMLYICDVKSKILTSMELIDLLYVSYNRDESEIYEIEKAVQSGCEDIYSVAQDVYEKKIKALNKEIEYKARQKAEEKLEEAKSKKQKRAENIIENYDKLLDEMAKMIIEENKKYIDKDIAEEAIENITKETNQKKRGRKKKEGNE